MIFVTHVKVNAAVFKYMKNVLINFIFYKLCLHCRFYNKRQVNIKAFWKARR